MSDENEGTDDHGQSHDTMPLPPLSVAFCCPCTGSSTWRDSPWIEHRSGVWTRLPTAVQVDCSNAHQVSDGAPWNLRTDQWIKKKREVNTGLCEACCFRSSPPRVSGEAAATERIARYMLMGLQVRDGRLFYKLMIDIEELHILIYRDNYKFTRNLVCSTSNFRGSTCTVAACKWVHAIVHSKFQLLYILTFRDNL
ncbi:hypothetical protein TRIUR3_09710 [Triticum urartu]|uniref:Uncharacterized protein n=1 Tax=Triticum urartu TaxID=4572 RepID=M7ZK85_TRIUA|nr:hypothetical protein TRIUR3_09710 [Triticum urartu]